MLRTDTPPITLAAGFFLLPDHADPNTLYLTTSHLAVADARPGEPDFSLVRYRSEGQSGAVLSLGVRLAEPPSALTQALRASGKIIKNAPFSSFSARLRMKTPVAADDRLTPWVAGQTGSGLARFGMTLSPTDAELFSSLLDTPVPAIEVDAVVRYNGVAGALPVIARVATARLGEALARTIPSGEVPADVLISAGVAALAGEPSLYATERSDRGQAPLDETQVRGEILQRLLPNIAVAAAPTSPAAPTLYSLLPTVLLPAETHVSLALVRPAEKLLPASLAFPDFLAGLSPATRVALFPKAADLDVLDQVELVARTTIPLDAAGVRRIDVGFRSRSVSGKIEMPCVTLTPATTSARLQITRNRFLPTPIERRVTAVVTTSDLPRILQVPYAPTGPVVTVDADTLGVRLVEVSAEAGVLERSSKLDVALRASADGPPVASHSLDPSRPRAAIALPDIVRDTPLWVRVTAAPPAGSGGQPAVLIDGPASSSIFVGLADLVRPTPIPLLVRRADSATSERYSYLAVTLRSPELAEVFLLLDGPRTVNLFAPDPFHPPRYSYQVEWLVVGQEAAGIQTSPPADGPLGELVIDPLPPS